MILKETRETRDVWARKQFLKEMTSLGCPWEQSGSELDLCEYIPTVHCQNLQAKLGLCSQGLGHLDSRNLISVMVCPGPAALWSLALLRH